MSTEHGGRRRITGRCGCRLRLLRDGLLIVRGSGCGRLRGDGPGWMLHRGDLLPFIMAGGFRLVATGAGLRGLTMRGPITRPRWWRGLEVRGLALASDSAAVSALELAEDSAGVR
jgi:hypothetical protein